MTIQEVLTEYEFYTHSKEHYDLLREETELSLMEMYIEDQKFIMENAEAIKSTTMLFENASADSLQLVKEAAEEKAANLFVKIWNGIKKAISFVIKAFKKLFSKIFKSDKQIVNFCEKHEFTQEELIKILKVNDSIPSFHGMVVFNRNGANINVADDINLSNSEKGLCSSFINFAIGNVVNFNVKSSDIPNAVSIDRFIAAVNNMKSFLDKDSAIQISKDIDRALEDNNFIPVDIYNDKNNLANKISELEDLLKILEEQKDKFQGSVNLRAAYENIVKVIPDTVKFYNGIILLHDKICTTIRSFM